MLATSKICNFLCIHVSKPMFSCKQNKNIKNIILALMSARSTGCSFSDKFGYPVRKNDNLWYPITSTDIPRILLEYLGYSKNILEIF